MKTYFGTTLRGAIATGALLLLGALGAASQAAQPKSPVGTWDCLLSGSHQQGIAFLTFTNDLATTNRTFSGYRLLVGTPQSSPGTDPRGSGSEVGRNSESGTNSFASTTLFGFDRVSGQWQY